MSSSHQGLIYPRKTQWYTSMWLNRVECTEACRSDDTVNKSRKSATEFISNIWIETKRNFKKVRRALDVQMGKQKEEEKQSSVMHCTAPVIVVCFFSFAWSYSTKLAEKGAWLLYSNESPVSSETIQGDAHVWIQYGISFNLQCSPYESTDKTVNRTQWLKVSLCISVKTWQHFG